MHARWGDSEEARRDELQRLSNRMKRRFESKFGDRVIGDSNLGKNACYDQILRLPTVPENFTNDGGAVDFHVDDAHIEELFPCKGYTREKFTYQMSDHFPIWIQMKTDIETFRLNQLIQDKSK